MPRPVGDLVKVAGIARSFEPLIYFSEPAVAHVKDLQSTSIAVWDLAESVRVSGMSDAQIIVQNLDSVSETMKKLVLDLTKFHTHVDGDIDRCVSTHANMLTLTCFACNRVSFHMSRANTISRDAVFSV